MAFESRRWRDDPMAISIICNLCKHFHIKNLASLTCDAFPQGIPHALMDRNEHDMPFPGDQGIRFEPDFSRYSKEEMELELKTTRRPIHPNPLPPWKE